MIKTIISLTLFLAFVAGTPAFSQDNEKIRFTLFIDTPTGEVDDILAIPAWDAAMSPPIPIDKLRSAMANSFSPLIESIGDVTNIGNLNINFTLLDSLAVFKKAMDETIRETNNSLDDVPRHLFVSYLPWEYSFPDYPYTDNTISFSGLRPGESFLSRPDLFNVTVDKNIRSLIKSTFLSKKTPWYLAGIIGDLKLQRDQSEILIQILIGLTPAEIDLKDKATNEQVALSHLVIPVNSDPKEAPMMMLTLKYRFQDGEKTWVTLSFGPYAGWSGDFNSLKLMTDTSSLPLFCGPRHRGAVYLRGILKKQAAPGLLGSFAEGKQVDFRIYDALVDLEATQVNDLNLFVSAGFNWGKTRKTFGCFNVGTIDEQFRTEVNNNIEKQIESLKSKITVNALAELLLSRTSGGAR